MAKLIYFATTSLDAYVADKDSKFGWAAPDEEVHGFANDLLGSLGTHLYGRKMYEVMTYWETAHTLTDSSPVEQDFAKLWQAADKVVYSRTLDKVASKRTRLEREFDVESVKRMKAEADRDMSVSGPHLAAQAIEAGLVDEYHLIIAPVIVGGGHPSLPSDVRVRLELKHLAETRSAGINIEKYAGGEPSWGTKVM